VEVRATVLTCEARDTAWSLFTSTRPGFQEYEERTSRVIPVVELTRRA
jgi:hypothetical protein